MAIPVPVQAGAETPKQPLIVHAITDLKSCAAVIKAMKDMKKCPESIRVPPSVWWRIFDEIGDPDNGILTSPMSVLGVPIYSR